MDEADRYLNPTTAGEALTAAINASSYRRLARKKVCVPNPAGGWDMHDFEFWCPMIMAGIRSLVDTVQDRCDRAAHAPGAAGRAEASPRQRHLAGVRGDRAQAGPLGAGPARARPRSGGAGLPAQPRGRPVAAAVRDRRRGRRGVARAGGGGGPGDPRRARPGRGPAGAAARGDPRGVRHVGADVHCRSGRPADRPRGRALGDDQAQRRADRRLLPARHAEGRGRAGRCAGARRRADRKRDRHYYTRADFEQAWARYISRDPENDPAHPAHPAPEARNPRRRARFSGAGSKQRIRRHRRHPDAEDEAGAGLGAGSR